MIFGALYVQGGIDPTYLASATSIDLVPTTAIRTDSNITTLSTIGGSKIDFAGGSPDGLFDINKDKVRLHWNDASAETATILLDNQYDTTSNIAMTFTTATGDITTKIDNIAASQSVFLNDTRTGNVKSITLDNNANNDENRMYLIQNSGGGVVAQSGIVNASLTQMLFVTHTDNSNSKALSLRQDVVGTGKLQYDNTIDSSAFEISSVNTDLILSAPNTAGSGSNIEINPAGQLIFSSNLEASSSTGSSGKYLKIKLNGVNYSIPLDFA